MADPLLNLLAGALRLWIRSRCDRLGDLQLTLEGSSMSLLRGRLDGARLIARDASFQGLPLQHVDLRSEAVAVDLKLLTPGRMLALQQSFKVKGSVSISGTHLNDALLVEQWRWLGDWLAEQLMGLTPLGSLQLDNDVMVLQASVAAHKDPAVRRFRLSADQGSLLFRPEGGEAPAVLLPMDPAIQITDAQLGGGQLHMEGQALVTPT